MIDLMQKIVSLCKRRGFVFPSSEIYGGVAGLWDFGPLGSLMKNNIKELWLKRFIQEEENVFLIDGTVLMHPKTWEASGHIANFTDPLMECKKCHTRFRADHLEAGRFAGQGKAREKKQCTECGGKEFTDPRMFNLMFKTFIGPVEDKTHQTHLRPETAQSMFVNFQNVLDSSRTKLPFGIGQIGRCFRNEITTGDFTFRSREFDIAEIEFFVEPGQDDKWFDYWVDRWEKFYLDLGLKKKNLRRFEHPKESLAHYSKRTIDIEYKFPFGWSELAGIANRTDFDLKRHSQFSGQDLTYFDPSPGSGQAASPGSGQAASPGSGQAASLDSGQAASAGASTELSRMSSGQAKEKYFPYVIEPTMGIERALLAVLCEAYEEVKGGRTETTESAKEIEVVLKLDKKIAPIKVAVLPLVKNKPDLVKKAQEVYHLIKPYFVCQYDEVGSIGRRYRRQDEIGTPYCITVDFDTLEKEDVTLRNRDTMKQERIKIKEIIPFLKNKIENE